jgi:hypothetical protein
MRKYLALCLRDVEFETQLLDSWNTSEAYPIINTRVSGVYLLAEHTDIVYVGQSQNIMKRIGEHIEADKFKFHRYLYIEENEEYKRRNLEGQCIRYFNPEHNNAQRS